MFFRKPVQRLLHAVAQRHDKLANAAFRLSEFYQNAYKNFCYDMEINGECWLLDRLREIPITTIFDVGANRGRWSAAASLRFPDAEIHAFEIVPATYGDLEAAARSLENVRPKVVPGGWWKIESGVIS
jgi:hypothetical protein